MPGFTEILIIVAIILAIFVLPKRLGKQPEPVKRPHIQGANLNGWQRMAILLSILWLSSMALYLKPWMKNINEWYIYIYAGVGPVFLYWGIFWIIKGFKKKGR